MQLDTLYKRTKTGAIQYWRIDVEKLEVYAVIVKESGQLGTSNPIIHQETIDKGVNIGRSNETTPHQQAELQARSDWKKQKDKGYKSISDLGLRTIDMTVYQNKQQPLYHVPGTPADKGLPLELALDQVLPQFNTDASGNVKPMLATDWKKIKKINYPVLVQPKLDGVRCLMIVEEGNITFLSRSGKEYTTLDHIADSVQNYALDENRDFILDGEIYSDELTFQEITQAVKKLYPNSLKLHFRAYDIVHEDGQEDRVMAHMPNIVKAINSPYIHAVPTNWADNADEVTQYHNLQVQTGFEGAMIRIPHGKYEQGCRSRTLLKVKEFDEAEFKLLELQLGQREEDVLGLCKTATGLEFRAKLMGSREQKAKLVEELGIGKFIGDKQLTVKHFGWTTDGLPRFPIGRAIRDYE